MSYSLKDQVGREFVERFAAALAAQARGFDKRRFLRRLFDDADWRQLELKQRIRAIVEELGHVLPGDYKQQVSLLKKVAPDTKGLGALLFPDFVQVYGVDHWDTSIAALKYFTPYFSSEFAVRIFIAKDQQRMLATMLEWSRDADLHVRRLASEGCRPRLPWSFKLRTLIADPSPILPILQNLRADESAYVRKSVANNLNDISKDHPDLVLRLAKQWLGEAPVTDHLLKHALRGLLKKGDARAMRVFKLQKPQSVRLAKLRFAKTSFAIGTAVEFAFDLMHSGQRSQKVRLDYVIHYRKKSAAYSQKVFKLAERELPPLSRHRIAKKHSLKQMTTRTHYPGEHFLEIAVNGVRLARRSFLVT